MNISKGIVLADSTSSECKIIKAEALDGMILIVTFSNNEERLFDASLLEGEVFYHWRIIKYSMISMLNTVLSHDSMVLLI